MIDSSIFQPRWAVGGERRPFIGIALVSWGNKTKFHKQSGFTQQKWTLSVQEA